jgi:hypothetical protein
MLMFAQEFQRRSTVNGWNILSAAAHPGLAETELIANGPGADRGSGRMARLVVRLLGQSSFAGALPSLFAATSSQATPGAYYGPSGFDEMKGPAGMARIRSQALDVKIASELWQVSEQLTRVSFAER